jgi:phage FluMu gp28-like protein
VKLILLDVDGTLVHPQSIDDAFFQLSQEAFFGFRDVNSDWSVHRHTTDSGIFDELFEQRMERRPTPD